MNDRLVRKFERFAEEACGPYAPTWRRVAHLVARTPSLLALAERTRPGQQEPNLLLSAVHWLLLDGARPARDVLAELDDAQIVDLVLERADTVAELVGDRLVQTNEVRRCSYLRPALAHVATTTPLPLALVEVGASAGLLLGVDRYRYDYGPAGTIDGPSPVRIEAEVRGGNRPPMGPVPLASKVGIDLHPVDPADADDARWLRALVWPDHLERLALLEAALADAAAHPAPVVAGDAFDVLPEIVADIPPDLTPVVFHTMVLLHVPPPERARFAALVEDLRVARGGNLRYVASEIVHEGPPLRGDGRPLAEHHQHGAWLTWLA